MSYSSLNPLRYCFGIGEPYTSKIASKIQIWMDIYTVFSAFVRLATYLGKKLFGNFWPYNIMPKKLRNL